MSSKNKRFTVWHLSLLILSVFILSCSEVVEVSSVTIDGGNQTVSVGSSITLSVALLPENAEDKTLAWTSSDLSVASIDATSGEVNSLNVGTTVITVVAGGKSDSITLTVKEPVTSLSVEFRGSDYPAVIEGTAASLTLPGMAPSEIAVKGVLLTGATGLEADTGTTISLTNGIGKIPISTNGITKTYTLTVTNAFTVESIAKSAPDKDRRFHYTLFTISTGDVELQGRHKLALKPSSSQEPGVQEMTDGTGLWRRIGETAKRILLPYHIDSGIKAFTEANLGQIRLHGGAVAETSDTYDINQYLLRPGTAYTLYALKEGSQRVLAVAKLSTDIFDSTAEWPLETKQFVQDTALTGTYSYDAQDPVFVMPAIFRVSGYIQTFEYYASASRSLSFRLTVHPSIINNFSISIGNNVVLIFPEESTDGTKKYAVIDNKDISIAYLLFPQSWLGTEAKMDYSNIKGDISFMTITAD